MIHHYQVTTDNKNGNGTFFRGNPFLLSQNYLNTFDRSLVCKSMEVFRCFCGCLPGQVPATSAASDHEPTLHQVAPTVQLQITVKQNCKRLLNV
jgi:hypothetical protein